MMAFAVRNKEKDNLEKKDPNLQKVQKTPRWEIIWDK